MAASSATVGKDMDNLSLGIPTLQVDLIKNSPRKLIVTHTALVIHFHCGR